MSTLPPDKPPDRLLAGGLAMRNGEKIHGEGKSEKKRKMDLIKNPRREENTREEIPSINRLTGKSGSQTYSTITRKNENKAFNLNPLWNKIFIDWRDNEGKGLRGFSPTISHYKKLLKILKLNGDEITRINDCKSAAGYIIIELGKPIHVISHFDTLNGLGILDDDLKFSVRGLENARAAQSPIDVLIKNGSETNLKELKEIMEEYGDIVGGYENVPHSVSVESETDVHFSKLFNNILSGKIKFRIKPRERLPMVVPVGGRKVELVSSLQMVQCFRCLRFGHTKVKCPFSQRATYNEFNEYFRLGLGLPTRISSAEERRTTEEASGLEEEEERQPEGEGCMEDQVQPEDGGQSQEGRQVEGGGQPRGRGRPEDEKQLPEADGLEIGRQPVEELPGLKIHCGRIAISENNETAVTSVSKRDDFPSLQASALQSNGIRDDWMRVMQRGSSIPMKKTNSNPELKKSKRVFTSPEANFNKRTRDSDPKDPQNCISSHK